MLKKTTIKNLEGLIISDPSYSNDVWCRYYTDKKFKNVVITLETTLEEDIFGRSISFKLLIAEKELSDLIGLGEKANPTLPVNYKKGKREIGMDTATDYSHELIRGVLLINAPITYKQRILDITY